MFYLNHLKKFLLNNKNLEFIVPNYIFYERIDKFLYKIFFEHSYSIIINWIQLGMIYINYKKAKINQFINQGERLFIFSMPKLFNKIFFYQYIDFNIIKEDVNWILINKPPGLVTHPSPGNWNCTLLNGLINKFEYLKNIYRAGIINRLDKETSGVMIVAKNDFARLNLKYQIENNVMVREYMTIVGGKILFSGIIKKKLNKDLFNPMKMSENKFEKLKKSTTFIIPNRFGYFKDLFVTKVFCIIKTGKKHQIRSHLSSIKHPILGDNLYGGKNLNFINRHMLHSRMISFKDPYIQKKFLCYSSNPFDMVNLISKFNWIYK